MKYLFGPVPSRRLGISLGVDLVPHKVCSLNCIYCEVGRTTNLTIERKEYIPVNEVIDELKDYLDQNKMLDTDYLNKIFVLFDEFLKIARDFNLK